MPLSPGDKLGPYEIVAPIGAGGMGEVYRARDPRLNRDVAIKVSAAQFSERFEREAKAIAALNHPNICQIYDVGPNYLVMELVEGPTLAERIAALGPGFGAGLRPRGGRRCRRRLASQVP
jgi:serine/threonine protein kinase